MKIIFLVFDQEGIIFLYIRCKECYDKYEQYDIYDIYCGGERVDLKDGENELDDMALYILNLFILLMLLLWKALDHFMTRNHKTSRVIGGLLNYFKRKGDQVIEFRIAKENALQKKREFQVKTIHRNYYVVRMNGVEVVSTSQVDEMTISKIDAYLIGEVDPTNLDKYELSVAENMVDRSFWLR